MGGRPLCLLALVAFILTVTVFSVNGKSHTFPEGYRVPLYANRVGPFINPRCDGSSAPKWLHK